MTYLQFRFYKDLLLILVGLLLPPLYFILRKKYWIGLSALGIMVIAPKYYGVLFCMAIALLAGINQLFTDWKHREILIENAPFDKTYKGASRLLRLFGVRCVDYSNPTVSHPILHENAG